MKKRSVLAIAILALLLSLVVIMPAGATDDSIGFNVDCEKAVGYGWVPAHACADWSVRLWTDGDWRASGQVCGGEDGVAFNPTIEWPYAPVSGVTYYWLSIDMYWSEVFSAEGHFDCEPPPPPPPPPPPCGEGCTPGYWKQPQHLDSWDDTPYRPSDDFDTVFGGNYFAPDITLLDALKLKGGGFNALARHAVAGLLNASHPDVEYGLTTAEVIALLEGGTEANKDILEYYNELGCPLD